MPFDVEMVERELTKANIQFEKIVVDSKQEFENAMDEFVPDIVLSDHSLPSFNSEGALKIVKEKAPLTPFILVTATVSEEFAVNVLKQGASDYILKTNLSRLPSAVLAAIENTRIKEENILAEYKLKQSYQQLRKLASHLQDIREEERTSIAREVHDELGQQLTALKLDISWLSLKLHRESNEIVEKISSMEKLISTSLSTVKKIVTELHPAILDKLGIKDAIRWQSHEFEKRTGIKIDINLVHGPLDIGEKTAIVLFRIFQETLTNIVKHAKATHVRCSIDKKDNQLLLIIRDDGVGFDETLIEQNQSLGLLGMNERAIALGGTFKISTEPGKGTTVFFSVPL